MSTTPRWPCRLLIRCRALPLLADARERNRRSSWAIVPTARPPTSRVVNSAGSSRCSRGPVHRTTAVWAPSAMSWNAPWHGSVTIGDSKSATKNATTISKPSTTSPPASSVLENYVGTISFETVSYEADDSTIVGPWRRRKVHSKECEFTIVSSAIALVISSGSPTRAPASANHTPGRRTAAHCENERQT